jgi:hypothetical protein
MIIGSNEFVEGDSSGYEVDLSIKGIFLLTITLYFSNNYNRNFAKHFHYEFNISLGNLT